MTQNTSKHTATVRTVIFYLTVAFLAAASVQAGAQSDDSTERPGLVGTWAVPGSERLFDRNWCALLVAAGTSFDRERLGHGHRC